MNAIVRTVARLAIPVLLAFLGALGCVDPKPGDTTTTPIYVYDDASRTILAWDDVNAIYDTGAGGTAPDPSRTITGPLLTNLDKLAWGGMVINPSTNQMFLVSESGTVVRIEKVSNQSGSLSQVLDIATFTLGNASSSGDRLTNSVFGQAAIDTSTGTLYVTETGSSNSCRIWMVTNAGSIYNNGQAPSGNYLQNTISPDNTGTGVAAGTGGIAFAYFLGGPVLTDPLNNSNSGPRLRMSTGSSFEILTKVLVGDKTLLGTSSSTTMGTLAYDTTFNRLYVARNVASGGKAVVVFTQGQFTIGNMNQEPTAVLPDTVDALPNLRFLAHARTKDWLAGADMVTGTGTGAGTNVLRLWKGPSSLTPTASIGCNLGSAVTIRGIALDGSD